MPLTCLVVDEGGGMSRVCSLIIPIVSVCERWRPGESAQPDQFPRRPNEEDDKQMGRQQDDTIALRREIQPLQNCRRALQKRSQLVSSYCSVSSSKRFLHDSSSCPDSRSYL